MALTGAESAALMVDMDFRGRIKVCCVKYGDSIAIASVAYSTQASKVKWMQRTEQMPDTVAAEIQPRVVMDANVQEAGKNVTDTVLQGAVESVVNKSL